MGRELEMLSVACLDVGILSVQLDLTVGTARGVGSASDYLGPLSLCKQYQCLNLLEG